MRSPTINGFCMFEVSCAIKKAPFSLFGAKYSIVKEGRQFYRYYGQRGLAHFYTVAFFFFEVNLSTRLSAYPLTTGILKLRPRYIWNIKKSQAMIAITVIMVLANERGILNRKPSSGIMLIRCRASSSTDTPPKKMIDWAA